MPRRRNLVLTVLLSAAALACSRFERQQLDAIAVARTTLRVRAPELINPVAKPVQRNASPQLEFEVELTHPPLGAALELTCQWRAPSGDVRYDNAWQTKPISHDPWPTHCRHAFTPGDDAGHWTVVMKAAQRELGSADFTLD
jgi:hypothetical protein